ncbi:MAG: hypothetical protein AAGA95_14065 [Pseudomonadota bacterium]
MGADSGQALLASPPQHPRALFAPQAPDSLVIDSVAVVAETDCCSPPTWAVGERELGGVHGSLLPHLAGLGVRLGI